MEPQRRTGHYTEVLWIARSRGYIAVCDIAVCLAEVDPVVVDKFPLHHHLEKYASFDALLCEQPRRTSAQQRSITMGANLRDKVDTSWRLI
jgi:hypothetical protein